MISILDLLLPLFGGLLDQLTKSSAPTTVTDAVKAAIDALAAHQQDLITKAALEANRG